MSYQVFAIKDYQHHCEQVIPLIGGHRGEVDIKAFPDGERYLRIRSNVRDQDVVLLGGTLSDQATMELFDLACGLVSAGCRSLRLILPYFGYSTMERAVFPGDVVTAKNRARLLSAVPLAPFGNQVVMLDLHSEGIPFYFEGAVKTQHLYAKPLILAEARRLGGEAFTLGAPDAGRAKWVQSLANDLGVPAGFVYKSRGPSGELRLAGVNVDVAGSRVVIYDDMIRSGSSILQAAQAYQEAGAKQIFVITTHGIFTPGALERLKASALITSITCTDSHTNALHIKDPFLKVLSTAELFADYLKGGRDAHS